MQLVQAVVIAQLAHVLATLDTPEPHVILVPPTTMEVEHACTGESYNLME